MVSIASLISLGVMTWVYGRIFMLRSSRKTFSKYRSWVTVKISVPDGNWLLVANSANTAPSTFSSVKVMTVLSCVNSFNASRSSACPTNGISAFSKAISVCVGAKTTVRMPIKLAVSAMRKADTPPPIMPMVAPGLINCVTIVPRFDFICLNPVRLTRDQPAFQDDDLVN